MNGLGENGDLFDNIINFDDEEIVTIAPSMDAKEIHAKLAADNIRIFTLRLTTNTSREVYHWIHNNKTVAQWREDVRTFVENSRRTSEEGWACSEVFNGLFNHLHKLGYHEIDDVVADVYEGRITNNEARLVDDPNHEEQKDGFGHYGWESK